MLELLDMAAIGATSIATAMPLLAVHPDIRLLICDLRLPGENGADLGIRIAERPDLKDRRFKIIFMSGDIDRVEAMKVERGQIILTKPIDPSVLIDTIFECLDDGPGPGALTG